VKLLLIEDDQQTADFIIKGLSEIGHQLDHFADGQEGLVAALSGNYDLILADRRLPSLDGLSVVRRTRAAGIETPFIFLTTMDGVNDRVDGLDAGGDDYLVKPFAFSELRARIDALTRRPQQLERPVDQITIGPYKIDLIKRCVFNGSRQILLQPREFRLLEYLARNAGRVATKTMLLEHVWEFNFDPKTNIIETHISRLRTKIDDPDTPSIIKTIRGAGYMINAD